MSLEEIWERIEALKEELEELGAKVKASERTRAQEGQMRTVITLTAILTRDLKEEV